MQRNPGDRANDRERDADDRLLGILVTYRRPAALEGTLRRVAEQDRPLDGLVVVDNAAMPESEALVGRSGVAETSYLASSENVGPAGAIALAMRRILQTAGDEDWVVLLDDDDPPLSSTWFGDLLRFGRSMADRDPTTAAVGFGGGRFDWARARLVRPPFAEYASPVRVDYFPSGHMPLYRVRAIRDVGTFDEALFFGFDDLEFGVRLRRAGFALYGLRPPRDVTRRERPKVKPKKRKIGLTYRLSEPTWRHYYSLRNLIFILRTYGRHGAAVRVTLVRGVLKPIANAPIAPRLAYRHLRLNLRASRDAWRGTMGRSLEPDGDTV